MATALAIKDFPGMNISVEGNFIVQHAQINLNGDNHASKNMYGSV
jgi:hypothetical protein